ncbi:gliding motility lipoprotein GldD [Nonlabens mediterrranea]|uniref:Gliding motility lipoprotein GldD n=1 Tax=Nonlabens mediterrranea TaxID=1419947 RepID=A0ABS0A833_9FLAO|nr:gliding motility lipoprotein GldD [Nonlabens mediterrranea]
MYQALKFLFILITIIALASCGNDALQPKPEAKLALQYPSPEYQRLDKGNCPFTFEVNSFARVLSKGDCAMKIEYPFMDATVYMDYAPVKDNIRELLIDGQKLSFSHNRMADVIDDKIYLNPDKSVYGMMYAIEGNAASNVQFYLTDSVQNFITASLYFDRAPNYDSIYPAVDYIKLDMRKMMESMNWK